VASERNRIIDGWRGICVLLVVIDHLIHYRFVEYFETAPFRTVLASQPPDLLTLAKNVGLRFPHPLAQFGLDIFLVITGYLITARLLEEEKKTGAIHIGAFYIRRAFRILPALYVLLVSSFLLSEFGILPIENSDLITVGAFLCNTNLGHCGWWFGHTFTLSIQEQFYALWPLGFVLLGPSIRSLGLGFAFVVLLFLSYIDALRYSFIDNAAYFSCIIAGALYACSNAVSQFVDKRATGTTMIIAGFLLLSQPFLYSLPAALKLSELFTPALAPFIFFGTLRHKGFSARIVSQPWLIGIGAISYSVYLWQQMFAARPYYAQADILGNPLLIVPCAVVSYVLVERPLMNIGHRLSARITERAHVERKLPASSGGIASANTAESAVLSGSPGRGAGIMT
jgi:peptidoglycan/LPS O-acetylase OafA/YrhL